MSAGILPWQSYGALLARLLPNLQRTLFAGADGSILWCSDPASTASLQPTLSILAHTGTNRHTEIDGLADLHGGPARSFGFRIRGALGDVLGFVVVALGADGQEPPELAHVHARLGPALDCLQSELAARAAIGELHAQLADTSRNLDLYHRLGAAELERGVESLGHIPALALEHLPGVAAVLLLPDRRISICRTPPDPAHRLSTAALSQLNQHLMTRAQLHGRTLVANRLAIDGARMAMPYKAISTPIFDAERRVIGAVAVFRLESDTDFQLQDAEILEMLARKAGMIVHASFDPDTGLLTQAAFIAQAEAQMSQESAPSPAYGVLYVDIDQLSVVNESHGMPAGDEVIDRVAGLLVSKARGSVLAARLGGDRFALFVPGCGIEPAARVAEELRSAAVKFSRTRDDKPVLVSLSIGVARVCDLRRPLPDALAAAELACRTAKLRGRNRVEVHFVGGGRGAAAGNRGGGGWPLIAASVAGESQELLAQPVLPLGAAPADPRFAVLLRMRAPAGARLGYEKWAQADADPALARRIDLWVMEQVLTRLDGCREILRQHPASFSLNLTGASLGDAEFWRMLESTLRVARIEPGVLGFEFPEAAVDGRVTRIAAPMRRLRDLGVPFALDNFGRDSTSLSNLNALPVSSVKIDGRLGRSLLRDPHAQSMFIAITKLAQGFGLDAIATSIETDPIRARAAALGADFGQGFFIGKPVALDDALRDLSLYSCFSTSTGLFDFAPARAGAKTG